MGKKSANGFASEVDLAKVVVAWLTADGWAVHQEVEHRGDVADIVATKDGLVAVVECKLGLTLGLIAQGQRWLHRANRVYLAVPLYGSRDTKPIGRVICRSLGLGLLDCNARSNPLVTRGGAQEGTVIVTVDPAELTPSAARPGGYLVDVLCPEHQTFAEAGAPTGARWTAFKRCNEELVALVTAEPGIVASAAVKRVKHDWRGKAPHATMVMRIRAGHLKGLRVEVDPTQPRGQQIRLYLATTTEPA